MSGSVFGSKNSPVGANVSIPFTSYHAQIRPRSIVTITFRVNEDDFEYLMFDGEVLGVNINKSKSSSSINLSLASPTSVLKRYKRYAEVDCFSPALTFPTIFMHPMGQTEQTVGTDDMFRGSRMADIIKSSNPSYWIDTTISIFKSYVSKRASVSSGVTEQLQEYLPDIKVPAAAVGLSVFVSDHTYSKTDTAISEQESLFGYFDQFSFQQLAELDKVFEEYVKDADWDKFIHELASFQDNDALPLYDFMVSLYRNFFMCMVESASPTKWLEADSFDGNLGSMYRSHIAYDAPLSCPPACNVITPDMISGSINMSRDFGSEPTRGAFLVDDLEKIGLSGSLAVKMFASPSYKFSELASVSGKEFDQRGVTDLASFIDLAFDNDRAFGNNEALFMPSAQILRIPPYALYVRQGKNFKVSSDYYQRYADWEFADQKYSHRGASASCRFSPQLMVGFPCFVADNKIPIFGVIADITHGFSRDGGCSTSIGISHVTTPSDYINPLTRSAHGILDGLTTYKISNYYFNLGMGGSMLDLVAKIEPRIIDRSLNAFRSILKDLGDDLANELLGVGEREAAIGVRGAVDNNSDKRMTAEYSKQSDLIEDEGLIKVLCAELIINACHKGIFDASSISEYSRPLVDVNHRPFVRPFEGDGFIALSRGYWFDDNEYKKNHPDYVDEYRTRRLVAEKIAKELNSGDSAVMVSTTRNVYDSIFSILSEDLLPRSSGEDSGISK